MAHAPLPVRRWWMIVRDLAYVQALGTLRTVDHPDRGTSRVALDLALSMATRRILLHLSLQDQTVSTPNTISFEDLGRLTNAVVDMLAEEYDLHVAVDRIILDVASCYFPANPRLESLCRIVPEGTPRRYATIHAVRTLIEQAWETVTGVPYAKSRAAAMAEAS